MPGILLAGGALTALLASSVAAQDTTITESVPSEQVTVSIATINGSGCPAGTTAVATSDDNTAFTVTYSQFLAQAGPGVSPVEWRKNCQLSLEIDIPGGFSLAIASADYRGYAYLDNNATALTQASYYYMGSSDTSSESQTLSGPLDDNWQATDSTQWENLVWSECGETRNLNVNTEVRVNPGSDRNATSFITMDSTDGSVSTEFHFAWKEC